MANNMDSPKMPVADDVAGDGMQVSCEEEARPGILDLLLILAARKGLIFGLVLLGGIISTVIAFLIPPTFTATAVIMPPQQQSSTAAALLGQLGGISAVASQSLGIKNPSDPFIGVLSSRSVADKLIAQFSLKEVYRVRFISDARKILAEKTSFSSAKYSLIHISVEDKSPKMAAALANAYVDGLQEQLGRLAVTEASQRSLFFERQLEAERKNLAGAEAAMKKTQELKGIFQVNSQVDAIIRSMAQLRAEIAAREVNLLRLKAGATMQNPEVQRQEIELKALKDQLNSLESNTSWKSTGDPFLPTSMVPAAGLEYLQRIREVKYHESLFEFLAKQYEIAKIDEAKEGQVIQVLDRAIPPERKSAPVRRIYVIVGIFLGGMLGSVLVLLMYATNNSKLAPKITALKKSFWMHRGKVSHK